MGPLGSYDLSDEFNARHIKDYIKYDVNAELKNYIEYDVNAELKNYIDNRYFQIQDLNCSIDKRAPQFIIKLVYFIEPQQSYANTFVEMDYCDNLGISKIEEKIERRRLNKFIPMIDFYCLQPGYQNDFFMMVMSQLVKDLIKDIRENYIDKNIEVFGIDLAIKEKVYEKPKVEWIMKYRRNNV